MRIDKLTLEFELKDETIDDVIAKRHRFKDGAAGSAY